jgi:hypothetical protein
MNGGQGFDLSPQAKAIRPPNLANLPRDGEIAVVITASNRQNQF